MKPSRFRYHRPTTVADAVGLLAEHGEEAKPLAGGQSLVALLSLRLTSFEHLVDLNRIPDLQGIAFGDRLGDRLGDPADGDAVGEGSVTIGAMTRQSTVERSDDVARLVPLLARAVPLIGHFQIRNRGTVGGSIAHADPASELPAVALALDARITATGPAGTRTVPAADFFSSTWTTTLEPGEILTGITFPDWGPRSGFAVEELARRRGDFAIAGAVCGVRLDPAGSVDRAAIALMGMGDTPVRCRAAEQLLVGSPPGSVDPGAVAAAAIDATEPPDDIHAPASYRRRVGAHLVARALASSMREATDG